MSCNRIAIGLLTVLITVTLTAPAWCAVAPDSSESSGKSARQNLPVTKPTLANVPYGSHERQVLDFWKADADHPTPLVFVIHGGGWQGGEKERVNHFVNVEGLLAHGISVVSINYRLVQQASAAEIEPPVKAPLHDAARALQFVRSKAAEWNIDKSRIGAAGGSAGACSSLWLAFHDDLADPQSSDLVARESTRLMCAAVIGAQTTLDPQQMKDWTPNSKYGGHAFGLNGFTEFLANRENILPWIAEYSPYALVTAGDPPVYLSYNAPPALGQPQKDPTHTANFGVKLQEKCNAIGVPCRLVYPGAQGVKHATPQDYLIATLRSPAVAGNPVHAHASRPNIIVIFTDDHGWADLGAQGVRKDIRTPNLDALAAGGLRAVSGYITAPQCVPSRAGLLSGRYQNRFGVESNAESVAPFAAERTIAERLREAGYVTGMAGKWHLGDERKIAEHGFDKAFFKHSNAPGFWNMNLEGKDIEPVEQRGGGYHLDLIADFACAFIKRHASRPFFFYLAPRAPHTPLDAPPKYTARFPGEMPERRRQALAMISAIDDGVGRILATLREHRLEERTLIFVMGDNGAPLKIHKVDSPLKGDPGGWDGSLNEPMNGEKGTLCEGGIRTPWLAYWKGTIPAGQAYPHPVISLDVAATAVALAGLKTQPGELDGVNLIPFFTGQRKAAPHERLYWRWTAQSAIREGQWKLLRGGPREYLFDLAADPGEKQNLLAKHPDIASRLRDQLKAWGADLKPPGVDSASLGRAAANYFDFYLEGKPAASPTPPQASEEKAARREERKQRRNK